VCFVFSTTLPENVLVLSRIERDMIINVYWSSCKVQVILVRFYLNKNFLDIFSKNTRMFNYMTVRPAGAERIHADGRTDRHYEANSRVSQFCKTAYKFYILRTQNICLLYGSKNKQRLVPTD